MTELLSQAAAGKRGALESLIEITEKNIMFFCRTLLPEEEANAVFAEVYGEMLEKVLGGFVASEQEFENKLKRLAALKCREYILKSKPQALRVPQNKNFIIEAPIASGEVVPAVMDSLPTMQKFLFALRRIAGLHDDDIAKIARRHHKIDRFASLDAVHFAQLCICIKIVCDLRHQAAEVNRIRAG